MSDIRFNQWLHQSGTGGVSQSDGGHVGIGTTNPLLPVGAGNTHILHVGVVTSNSISAGSSITATTFYGSGANLTSLPSQVTISNNADNRVITGGSGTNLNGESDVIIDSSGNLGIGAGTPRQKLHVGVSDSGSANMVFTNSTTGNSAGDGFIVGITGAEDAQLNMQESANLKFSTADTERLRITSTGKVLVNTTTASSVGNSTYSMFEVSGNTSGATGPGHLSLKRGTASASLSNGDTLSRLIFSSLDGGDFAYIQASVDGSPSGSDFPASLRFHTCADGASSSTERLRITSGGQIFIGGNTGFNESSALISIATDAAAGANMLSDSSAIYNHNNPAFIHVQNRYNTGTGQEAGIIFHSRSSYNGSWAIYGKRTSSNYLSDLIFRNRTGSGSSAERLRISSDGHVTKPAHPSFCARHNSGDGFSGDIIVLTRISTSWDVWNTGNHYSTSTGKFTAPVDGVYYFEAQAMTTGHSNGDTIQDMMSLESNRGRISYCRQRQTYFRSDENANGYFTNSVGGSIKLDATDTVWFQRKSGHTWGFSNRYYTYFTGWLIG